MDIISIWLSWKWSQARQEANARKEMRKRVLKRLQTKMAPSEVKAYNDDVIIESSGWFGGDYTEKDIKLRIWRQHRNLFKGKKFEDLARFYKKK